LYEVFPPTRFVSSFVSNDLGLGFLVVNAALVTFLGEAAGTGLGWHQMLRGRRGRFDSSVLAY
jgi:hypothetical protein